MPSDDSLDLFPEDPSERGAPAPARSPNSPDRPSPRAPLAERMRPRSLDEVVGQDALLGPGAGLRALVEADELPSLSALAALSVGHPDRDALAKIYQRLGIEVVVDATPEAEIRATLSTPRGPVSLSSQPT